LKKNYEIKCKIDNDRELVSFLRSQRKYYHRKENQVDIYYRVKKGRLKLRIINFSYGSLIGYDRDEKNDMRISRYDVASTSEFGELRSILDQHFKAIAAVEKSRDIFVRKNVRIHVDRVKKLGTFLEIEIIYENFQKARKQMNELIKELKLNRKNFIKKSYSDLIIKKR